MTGLEALKDIRSWFSCHDYDQHNEMDTIEKELKEYEQLKQLKLLPYPQENGEEYRQGVIKKLMALEIIRKYPFIVNLDYRLSYEEQKEWVREGLTQEEYDLLKEVLLNEHSSTK